ncbi:membrane subunit of NADH:quinone oxidoreductase/Mrp antiporter [Lipomyces tetrasporus]|uniref:Membrane subunit of NADH:quinone oxidoreductase/Mrp antiporter n=1 Tax=Lipomyces tetrasporus TaxID=54092 RepID=A0AAD7QRC9_9ASCO|nr:membrane subunit of NADH:quinone oxidoreductase/Mrp antiporter [Lipomyces tetrasporus]KAJ8100064.1 membrane subunit of NADH:quinone oxidoreductase/Mrp antiporter [Lipomyces tetrasporus]
MLLGVATIFSVTGTTEYDKLFNIIFSVDLQSILWIAIFASVMVKTPVFPIHTWLPVVHSESPLSGSILLAGVILKLAIYSCIRILIPILNEGTILYTPLIFVMMQSSGLQCALLNTN